MFVFVVSMGDYFLRTRVSGMVLTHNCCCLIVCSSSILLGLLADACTDMLWYNTYVTTAFECKGILESRPAAKARGK